MPDSLLPAREVPLGGPRAMTVRRTLPTRSVPTVGAWCFVDHYGSDDDPTPPRMLVPPHPHTGLQTVTWLVRGTVRHRDSLGTDVEVTPGVLALMTSGAGIAHSEYSLGEGPLHGVQLWVALPEDARHGAPAFAHHTDLPQRRAAGVLLTVAVGRLDGLVSPAVGRTPLLLAEMLLDPGASTGLELDPSCEHALLVLSGEVGVDGGDPQGVGPLRVLDPGRGRIDLASAEGARVLLLGGEPFTEPLVMWWNFLARDHDEIVRAREDWESGHPRFAPVAGEDPRLAAPPLPGVRLRPRTPAGAPPPPLS